MRKFCCFISAFLSVHQAASSSPPVFIPTVTFQSKTVYTEQNLLEDPSKISAAFGNSEIWQCLHNGNQVINLHDFLATELRAPRNAAHRARFERFVEPASQNAVSIAKRSADPTQLMSVALNFPLTKAGTEAAELAAELLVDHAAWLPAALIYKGLLRDTGVAACGSKPVRALWLAALGVFHSAGFATDYSALSKQITQCPLFSDEEKIKLDSIASTPVSPPTTWTFFDKHWREVSDTTGKSDTPIPSLLRQVLAFGVRGKYLRAFFPTPLFAGSLCNNLEPPTNLGNWAFHSRETISPVEMERSYARYPVSLLASIAAGLRETNIELLPSIAGNYRQIGLNDDLQRLHPLLIEKIRDQKSPVRATALTLLAANQKLLQVSKNDLIALINDSDFQIQFWATDGIAEMNSQPAEAIPALIQAMNGPSREIAYRAIRLLSRHGESATKQLLQALSVAAFEDEKSNIVFCLGRIGPEAHAAVPALIPLLAANSLSLRGQAAAALGNIGPKARAAIPQLIAGLRVDDSKLDAAYPTAIGKMGPEARAATQDLFRLINLDGVNIPMAAAEALGKVADPTTAIPKLIEDFPKKGAQQKETYARALGAFGIQAKPAAEVLVEEAAKRRGAATVVEFYAALGKIGADSPAAVATLIEAIPCDIGDVREDAVLALTKLGQKATDGFAAQLKDPEIYIRLRTLNSLQKIVETAPSLIPASVVELEADPSHLVRTELANLLGRLSMKPNISVPLLTRLLSDRSTYQSAAKALGRFGKRALPALSALRAHLNDPDENSRAVALETIGKIGPGAVPAYEDLKTVAMRSDGSNPSVALEAMAALGEVGRSGLIEILSSENPELVKRAIKALGEKGEWAYPAVEKLRALRVSAEGKPELAGVEKAAHELLELLDYGD